MKETEEDRHTKWENFITLPKSERRILYLKQLYNVLKGRYKEGLEDGKYMFSSENDIEGIKFYFNIFPGDNRDKIYDRFIKEVEKEFYGQRD